MKMNNAVRPFLLVCLAALLAWGCAAEDRVTSPASASAASPAAGTPSERERVIHLTMEFRVTSALDGARAVREAIAQEEGYVASANEQERRATFDARVPAARLEVFRGTLRDVGELVSVVEEATDVTAQHRDLSALLAGARAEETRLLALMNASTANLADVLAVERELARVSTSIAQLEASERDLSAQVAMAQVSITLVQESAGFAQDPVAAIGDAATQGVHAARNLAVGSTIALAAMGPSLALMLLVLFALWRTVKFIGTRIAAR